MKFTVSPRRLQRIAWPWRLPSGAWIALALSIARQRWRAIFFGGIDVWHRPAHLQKKAGPAPRISGHILPLKICGRRLHRSRRVCLRRIALERCLKRVALPVGHAVETARADYLRDSRPAPTRQPPHSESRFPGADWRARAARRTDANVRPCADARGGRPRASLRSVADRRGAASSASSPRA
jgi:hypothetical protein